MMMVCLVCLLERSVGALGQNNPLMGRLLRVPYLCDRRARSSDALYNIRPQKLVKLVGPHLGGHDPRASLVTVV